MREIKTVDIDLVEPNPYQPRVQFEEEALMDLAQSIRENGLIQPVTVREVEGTYQIIAGERRYRAMRLNGATEVMVHVMDANDLQMAELALVENIQRSELSAIEEAKAYVDIMKLSGITQSQLALKIGKSQSAVANKIRLLNLDESVQNALRAREITERHARALLAVESDRQEEALKTIKKKGLNVAQTEKMVAKSKKQEEPKVGVIVKKAISKSLRIAINTLKQAVAMINRTGAGAEYEEEDREEDVLITIRIPK